MGLATHSMISCLMITFAVSTCVRAQNTDDDKPLRPKSGRARPPRGYRFVPGKVLPVPMFHNTKVGTASDKKLKLPVPDNSLWFRYYQAGEDAHLKNDPVKAKQYWMASLTELEKIAPNPKDEFISVKLSALQIGLIGGYPTDWSKLEKPSSEKLSLQHEQVQTLYRISAVNNRLVPQDTLLCSKSKERYETAKHDYEKTRADAKNNSPISGK